MFNTPAVFTSSLSPATTRVQQLFTRILKVIFIRMLKLTLMLILFGILIFILMFKPVINTCSPLAGRRRSPTPCRHPPGGRRRRYCGLFVLVWSEGIARHSSLAKSAVMKLFPCSYLHPCYNLPLHSYTLHPDTPVLTTSKSP